MNGLALILSSIQLTFILVAFPLRTLSFSVHIIFLVLPECFHALLQHPNYCPSSKGPLCCLLCPWTSFGFSLLIHWSSHRCPVMLSQSCRVLSACSQLYLCSGVFDRSDELFWHFQFWAKQTPLHVLLLHFLVNQKMHPCNCCMWSSQQISWQKCRSKSRN